MVVPSSGSIMVNGASRTIAISFKANSVGGTLVATIPVGSAPIAVAYDSGNGYVYVANAGSNTVSAINGTTVVAAVPVGTDARTAASYDANDDFFDRTQERSDGSAIE